MEIKPFVTFVGKQCRQAEEALAFYNSIFPDSDIKTLIYYQEREAGGTPELIKYGIFTLNGVEYGISESNFDHQWSFSPAVSFLSKENSEILLLELFNKLSENGGQIMVPFDHYETGDYGVGNKFGWCADKFGVNWQFILT
jgi:predicted 3-demethylubiquinone-9 3-methyltransferase (glyoxalase superfamily)